MSIQNRVGYVSTFVITLCLLIIPHIAQAQIPQTLSYQGVLTDDLGNPVADGTYDLGFSLYDALTGGTALWFETQSVRLQVVFSLPS